MFESSINLLKDPFCFNHSIIRSYYYYAHNIVKEFEKQVLGIDREVGEIMLVD